MDCAPSIASISVSAGDLFNTLGYPYSRELPSAILDAIAAEPTGVLASMCENMKNVSSATCIFLTYLFFVYMQIVEATKRCLCHSFDAFRKILFAMLWWWNGHQLSGGNARNDSRSIGCNT